MQHEPSTLKLIVKACLILHNLLRIRYPGLRTSILTLMGMWTATLFLELGGRVVAWRTHRQLQTSTPPQRKEKKAEESHQALGEFPSRLLCMARQDDLTMRMNTFYYSMGHSECVIMTVCLCVQNHGQLDIVLKSKYFTV